MFKMAETSSFIRTLCPEDIFEKFQTFECRIILAEHNRSDDAGAFCCPEQFNFTLRFSRRQYKLSSKYIPIRLERCLLMRATDGRQQQMYNKFIMV